MPSAHSQPPDRFRLAHAALVAFLVALGVAPLWAVDLLPLLEWPQRLQLYTVLHDKLPDMLQAYPRQPFLVPCWLVPNLVHALAFLMPVPVAAKVVLTLAVAGMPLASLVLLRAVGHSRWLVLGVLPWMLNTNLFLGHLDHLAAFPLFLLLLAAHVTLLRQATLARPLPTVLRAAVVAGLLALLALTHPLLWLLGWACLPLLAVAVGWRAKRWRAFLGAVRDLLLGLAGLGLLLPWFVHVAGGWRGLRGLAVQPTLPLDDLRGLSDHAFAVFQPWSTPLEGAVDILRRPGDVASFLWLAGLLAWLLGAARQWRADYLHDPDGPRSQHQQDGVDGTAYAGWALTLVLVAYFVLPSQVYRPVWIGGFDFRLVSVAAVLGVVALPLRPLTPPPSARLRTWLGTLAMGTATVVFFLATLNGFLLAETELGPMREALATLPKRQPVLTLRVRPSSRYLRYDFLHGLGAWATVLRGATTPMDHADPQLQVLAAQGQRMRPVPHPDDHESFTWHDHGRYYRYIAVRHDPRDEEPRFAGWLRNLPQLYQRGVWQVFENPNAEAWQPVPGTRPSAQARPQGETWTECALAIAGLEVGVGTTPSPLEARLCRRLGWPVPSAEPPSRAPRGR